MDIIQNLQNITDFSGIPAAYLPETGHSFYAPSHPYLPRIAHTAPQTLYTASRTASAVLTDELLCYGRIILRKSGEEVLFGPVASIGCNNARAQRILRKSGLPVTESGKLLGFLKSFPLCSYLRFCRFICWAHFLFNQEDIEIADLAGDMLPPDETVSQPVFPTPARQLSIHDAQAYENELFSMIRFGQYEKMKAFLQRPPYSGSQGMLASDMLRHSKNLLIASFTLAARCAVQGGVDYESAMSLADAYIQKVELAQNYREMKHLQESLLKTCTRMVWERKHNDAEGSVSARAHHYIESHVGENLTGQTIADALGISRAYLSSQFKEETGIGLNDFINQIKVEEVKRLLVTTDLTVADIAQQTAFSSQSYLNTVFKRFTGISPIQYRKSEKIPAV